MGRGLSKQTLALRSQCWDILSEIQPATVRAVCYRLFVAGHLPNMEVNSTQKVSRVLTQARYDEVIPWAWIVDETRELERISAFIDLTEYGEVVRRSYRKDRWADQPQRVEVWSEKGSMRGTLKPVLDRYGVGFRVMHGFGSATAMNDVAEATRADPVPLRVFYLGDYDPSGMHMSEVDIPRRMDMSGGSIELVRLALLAGDLDRPDIRPTAFPAKRLDPRYRWFVDRYGPQAWELDAMSPAEVRDRVEAAIDAVIEPEAWERATVVEDAERGAVAHVADMLLTMGGNTA